MSCSISIFNLFYYNMVDVKKWYQVSKSSISSRQMQNSLGGGSIRKFLCCQHFSARRCILLTVSPLDTR